MDIGGRSSPPYHLMGKMGRINAICIQPRMLNALEKWACKAGGSRQFTTHLGIPQGLDINEKSAFVLTFWTVPEVPNQGHLLREIQALMKEDGVYVRG
jgi:hypothetical protein